MAVFTYQLNGITYAKEGKKETSGNLATQTEWGTAAATTVTRSSGAGTVTTNSVVVAPVKRLVRVKSPKWARAPKGSPRY